MATDNATLSKIQSSPLIQGTRGGKKTAIGSTDSTFKAGSFDPTQTRLSSGKDNSTVVDPNTGKSLYAGGSAPGGYVPLGGNVPQGWDATTYQNFKTANPTLEPNAQDTALMNGTNNTNLFNPNNGNPLKPGESVTNQATGQNITQGSPFQAAFQQTKATGVGAPPTAGGAATTMDNTLKGVQPAPDTSNIDAALAADKGYQQLQKDYQDLTNLDDHKATLTDTYNELIKKAGIPAINTELLSTKNIIDGTEDNIRSEVTAVNGFATDSQVLALSSARNKTLIQNYNKLVDQKQMAMDSVNTMIGLAKEDQATARQNILDKMGIDEKLSEYRDKFVNAQNEGFKTIIGAVGVSGLYNGLMNTDPTGKSAAQVAKNFNMSVDQLKQLAVADAKTRAQDLQIKNLDVQSKQLDIASKGLDIKQKRQNLNDSSGLPNPAKAGQPGYTSAGIKLSAPVAEQQIKNQWDSIKAWSPGTTFIPPAYYNQAKAWWVENGLSAPEFDSILGQYKSPNTSLTKQYN